MRPFLVELVRGGGHIVEKPGFEKNPGVQLRRRITESSLRDYIVIKGVIQLHHVPARGARRHDGHVRPTTAYQPVIMFPGHPWGTPQPL